jgi:hypothetical protein
VTLAWRNGSLLFSRAILVPTCRNSPQNEILNNFNRLKLFLVWMAGILMGLPLKIVRLCCQSVYDRDSVPCLLELELELELGVGSVRLK